jgi:hypothetical protein
MRSTGGGADADRARGGSPGRVGAWRRHAGQRAADPGRYTLRPGSRPSPAGDLQVLTQLSCPGRWLRAREVRECQRRLNSGSGAHHVTVAVRDGRFRERGPLPPHSAGSDPRSAEWPEPSRDLVTAACGHPAGPPPARRIRANAAFPPAARRRPRHRVYLPPAKRGVNTHDPGCEPLRSRNMRQSQYSRAADTRIVCQRSCVGLNAGLRRRSLSG